MLAVERRHATRRSRRWCSTSSPPPFLGEEGAMRRTHRRAALAARALFAVSLVACSVSPSGTDSGASEDSGSDAGPGDSPDGNAVDPCAAAQPDALATVGCNGAPPGPGAARDGYGGRCDYVDRGSPGSCTEPGAQCAGGPGEGICIRPCTPADTFVSTGGCPAGSRCFTLDFAMGLAFCWPDCESAADCATDGCDLWGRCQQVTGP
jgi:hypothetical protein